MCLHGQTTGEMDISVVPGGGAHKCLPVSSRKKYGGGGHKCLPVITTGGDKCLPGQTTGDKNVSLGKLWGGGYKCLVVNFTGN